MNILTPRAQFVYVLPRKKYESEWGNHYKRPGFSARVLALLFRLAPHVGPFRVLAFPIVPTRAEPMFLKSFEATVEYYRFLLAQVSSGNLNLPNTNLDTGKTLQAGDYRLADEAYVKLVDKLADDQFGSTTAALQKGILSHFAGARGGAVSMKTLDQLNQLRAKHLAASFAEP